MHYADTSALVKLIVREPETAALRRWLADRNPVVVTGDLTRTELMRAVLRGSPERAPRVRELLESVELIGLTRANFDEAGRLAPATLRSLDALHLAVALSLGDELDSVLTYDWRMRDAARGLGLRTESPRE